MTPTPLTPPTESNMCFTAGALVGGLITVGVVALVVLAVALAVVKAITGG